MLNDNRTIDYRKFYSLSFSFGHSRILNFSTNDSEHGSEAISRPRPQVSSVTT